MNPKPSIRHLLGKKTFSHDELVILLSADKGEQNLIFQKASEVKQNNVGNKVYLRGLVEYSNICSKNCFYCGVRPGNKNVRRYKLSESEVLEAAQFVLDQHFASMVIQAGELSGNIDGAVRHAITKIAHLHFASTADAYRRLLHMGEQKFRCHHTGAPQLDDFLNARYLSSEQIRKKYRFKQGEPFILLLQHSVTYESTESYQQMKETLAAAKRTGMRCVVICPNNDAGSVGVRDALTEFGNADFILERNVSREIYGGLLSAASILVGNSSSALLEAPSFKLPAVNIGNRQRGRERGVNVIDCDGNEKAIYLAIQKGLSSAFRKKMKNCVNPYGDGKSSQRILSVLKNIPIDTHLLEKTLTY